MRFLRLFLLLLLTAATAAGQNITSSKPLRDLKFYPENYGARPDDSTNDKVALQACIDAAEAAGGGIVFINEGVWEIHPLATGIGLLVNGDKVCLRGVGKKSVIRCISSTATVNAFEVIAPEGYNTVTTPYGASGLWVEDLKVECDGYDYASTSNRLAHGLIGAVGCPWAIIRGVTFGNVCYHQLEVGFAKNVLTENCDFVGNTESSRIQIDCGSAGQRAVPAGVIECSNLMFRNCRLAGRDATSQTLGITWQVDIAHAGGQIVRNVTFDGCEIAPVYITSGTTYTGYGFTISDSQRIIENLRITGCSFYGSGHSSFDGIYLVNTNPIRGLVIEDNYFGAGLDCAGMFHQGGFRRCIAVGGMASGTTVAGGSGGGTTNYTNVSGVTVRNNRMRPLFTRGEGTQTSSQNVEYCSVGGVIDAVVTGNQIILPVESSTFTASGATLTSAVAHDLQYGVKVKLTTATTLPAGLSPATTYYVVDATSATDFKLATTYGGTAITTTDAGTGAHTWTMDRGNLTMGNVYGFLFYETQNMRFCGNSVRWQHSAGITQSSARSMAGTWQSFEAGSLAGLVECTNNSCIETGAGSANIGVAIFGASSGYVQGLVQGTTFLGTWTTAYAYVDGHGAWYPPQTKGSDVASATTINLNAATGDLLDVTGTTTITAVTLREGQEKTVRFTGVLTFTHGASLVLPGNANITTAAGDVAILRGYASGVVRCVNYQRQATAP